MLDIIYCFQGMDCLVQLKIFTLEVAAMSLILEIKLYAHQIGRNAQSHTKVVLRSADWLMCIELG